LSSLITKPSFKMQTNNMMGFFVLGKLRGVRKIKFILNKFFYILNYFDIQML
jgi:hypothetical protein